MNFDEIIDRRGTGSSKWDRMHAYGGVSPDDGIPMWVADMDFRAADVLQEAMQDLIERGNYGYFAGDEDMNAAVAWWMHERHGWTVNPDHMSSTAGLGHAIALILETYTDPGDEVIIFTPVYHEFTHKIKLTKRVVHEAPLIIENGVYHMDLDALEAGLTGKERMMLISSPHNPAGRIWTPDELRHLADICARHDLIMVADEIHHDLVYPGQTFTSFLKAAPEAADRTFVLTAASKTFNTAGARLGTVTIPNPELRKRFRQALLEHQTQPNLMGVALTRAAYSPGGADWVDGLVAYIEGNHRLFLDGIAQIPALKGMPMQSTYLAWVDFAATGMEMTEVLRRVHEDARVVPSVGAHFGSGGETFLRFNIGTPRARVAEAVERLQSAFADLQ
ncbi:PatB family C-S lyase [Roseovarius sp. BRH_c41]|jgi:cystathionine beta-lyase|uniref:MalY/PatB family protein n=1 Tax=Roseovarius sp. BRH_c41 TaxID=1629709 RepID=UPI0005F18CDB|nr:PatB family C-S lyase [Roseovarius sp. BRH_c41]KJS41298.1 MAG: aminotransferase [Roseovarius sp. BRH_c41]KJS44510.1 MAG: aminotransferase [Roseovarius sp. BRH_c41]